MFFSVTESMHLEILKQYSESIEVLNFTFDYKGFPNEIALAVTVAGSG